MVHIEIWLISACKDQSATSVWCCTGSVCCSVLRCVAVRCSVLQCVAVYRILTNPGRVRAADLEGAGCMLQCVAVCCSVLQCVAVCCCALQCAFKPTPSRGSVLGWTCIEILRHNFPFCTTYTPTPHAHSRAFTHIHTHVPPARTHTRARTHTHTYTYIHIHTHSYTHTHIHTYIHTYLCHVHTHTHTHTYIQTHANTRTQDSHREMFSQMNAHEHHSDVAVCCSVLQCVAVCVADEYS